VVADLAKLALSQRDYYTNETARNHEEYLSGHGEAPGEWAGGASANLGLNGLLTTEQYQAIFDARNPTTDQLLGATHTKNGLPAYDLVLRPAKSVSLVWAFGDEHTRQVVMAAHKEAERVAVAYADRCVGTRRGKGGREHVAGGGLLIARFIHRTSREREPLLHSHLVIANRIQGPDGRWTTIDGRDLYDARLAIDAVYSTHLEHLLTRELGLRWTPADQHGIREVEGISETSIRAWSTRRAQITQACEEKLERKRAEGGRPQLSPAEVRAEVLKTRKPKRHEDMTTLHQRWHARAAERGLDTAAEVRAALGRERIPSAATASPSPAGVGEVLDEIAGPRGVTEQASTFTRHDVIRALRPRLGPVPGSELEALADRLLASERVVPVAGLDARLARWTTPEVLGVERQLVTDAQERKGERVAVVPHGAVRATLAEYDTLGADQRAMVEDLVRGGDGVAVVVGRAGTGKTYALDAARHAWDLGGVQVVGAAPTGIAADELAAGANLDASTVDGLLHNLGRTPAERARLRARVGKLERHLATVTDPAQRAQLAEDLEVLQEKLDLGVLPKGGVLVVDEAGMVGTRKLAALAAHARKARCKLVLVGDDKQLQAIDMGGGFRALRQRLGASELTVNRRQRDPLDQKAVEAIRAGDAEAALALYEAGQRVTFARTTSQLDQAMLRDWWGAYQAAEQVVMLTQRRDDAEALNQHARQLLRDAGQLGEDQLTVRGRGYAVGDLVVTRRNERVRLRVSNGTRGRITAIDPGGSLTLATDRGKTRRLPAWYLARDGAGGASLNHAYATTGHKSQGVTVDRALTKAGAGLSLEWAYVAMTRVRISAHLYALARPEQHPELDLARQADADPAATLAAGMRTSRAQVAAIDAVERPGVHALSIAELRGERDRLTGALRPPDGLGGPDPAKRLQVRTTARSRAEQAAAEAEQHAAEALAQAQQYTGARGLLHRDQAARAHRAAQLARQQADQARARAEQAADRELAARRQTAEHAAWTERSAPDRSRLDEVTRELGWRKAADRQALALEQPAWAVGMLGRYPARGTSTERRDWTTAAEAIGDYRQAHGITERDPERALGDPPKDLRQRTAWRRVTERIDRAREHEQAHYQLRPQPLLGLRAGRTPGQDRELA
jgi:conjugative relaxase-like TrwC/TraI family protein